MVSWSALGRSFGVNLFKNQVKNPIIVKNVNFSTNIALYAGHEHKVFPLQPSRWQYIKFKDMFHYYTMVGLIPVCLLVFVVNVFVGPATLEPIPADYVPKHWEYYRHPITRFIARYIHNNPQQEYEKFMHFIDEEQQKVKLRKIEKVIQDRMMDRQDYQAYYYLPMVTKYLRIEKKIGEEMIARMGDDFKD